MAFVAEPHFAARIREVSRSLAQHFDQTSVARGVQYALGGRAQIVAEKRDGLEIELRSTCIGSRPTPYTQEILLCLDERGTVDLVEGECSCPMQTDCKHVACAALTWLATRGAPGGGRVANEVVPPRIVTGPIHLPREAQDWLRRLGQSAEGSRAGGANMPAKGDCVIYLLGEKGRTIAIVKARILKGGRLTPDAHSSPDPGWVYSGRDPPRYLGELDLPVVHSIARLKRSIGGIGAYSGWALEGVAGRETLERALATGRLRFGEGKEWRTYGVERTQIPLDGDGWLKWGPRVAATFDLIRGEFGGLRWTLRRPIDAREQPVFGIPVTPPLYLNQASGEIGELDAGLPNATAMLLLQMPEIDKETALPFMSLLHGVARAAGLDAVAERIPSSLILAKERPKPRLRIVRGRFRAYGMGSRDSVRWIAELWFDYPQGVSLPEDTRAGVAERWTDASGGARVLLRDSVFEAEIRRRFSAAGFPPRAAAGGYPVYRADADRSYMWPQDGSDRAWAEHAGGLFEVAYALEARIDHPEDFPHPLRDAGEVYQEFFETGTPQWFDLELGVMVDGKRVPIASALADWIRRTPHPQAWLERADPSSAVLLRIDPLGLVRLSAERLKRLLAPLIDTYAFDRGTADGKLKLSRLEAALIEVTPEAERRTQTNLAALRRRLENFNGITSHPPSAEFRAQLRPYQQAGLDWLQFLREYGLGGILADDMGLGKTVQALAHLDLEKAAGRADRPTLVVAPTSVLPNWIEEAARFAPRLRVLSLRGAQRGARFAAAGNADLLLTTYALLARDREALGALKYHYVVFDESQFLKNSRTQAHAVAASLDARHRIALTGTPIENNLSELWAHFNLLLPGFLGDAPQFTRTWRTPIERGGDSARLARLVKRVRPFVLRRKRTEVLDELPAKTEVVHHVELEGAQRDLYEALRIALDRKLRQAIDSKGIARSQIVILDALLKLRQACCDPRLVKASAAKAAHGVSAKLDELREMLEELLAEGRRVLLFSQFTSMLDLIEPELRKLGARHLRLDGSTADRETPVRRFQAGEADLFLISLRAGGTGLNLTAADTVIHYDPWWNPAVEAQATARAHRMGQEKAVFVYKLIARGTVEERIVELLGRKQALADALLGEGRARGPLITEQDIRALLAPMAEAL